MGPLGRYIDRLPHPALDRIATAQEWCTDYYVDRWGARCLVGHASDMTPAGVSTDESAMKAAFNPYMFSRRCLTVVGSFDLAVRRYGMDRVVRACKLRAAKLRSGAVEAPPVETAAV